MKRMLPAVLLAFIFHTVLLGIDTSLFFDNTITLPKTTAVTVTMSYRKPIPVVKPEKEVIKPKKVIKKEMVKPPEKPRPPRPEMVKIPKDPQPSVTEEEKSEESEEDVSEDNEILEQSHGDAVSNMQVKTEAIPLYKVNPPPEYPRTARRRGLQGTVMLSVLVNESGQVENIWVFTSSGYRLLDNAALKAVRNWLFEPGKIGERNAEMWVKVPVRFELK